MKPFTTLLLFVCLLFSGCQKTPPSTAQTLRINVVLNPTTLDPRKARDVNSITVCRMLFEGLARLSKQGVPELALAESFDVSSDGLTYTFHLKPTVWSNGESVTSMDFAESWKQILSPQFATDIAYQLYVIKNGKKVKAGELSAEHLGIRTPDAQTLIVELEQPTPYFLEVCATTPYFPVPAKVAAANEDFALSPTTFVGNGPFVLQSWVLNDVLRVTKNGKYWEAKDITLDAIEMMMLSQDTELRLFEEKKLDWAGSPLSEIPRDAMASLKEQGKLKISPFSGTYFFRVNTQETMGGKKNPLSSPEFRKALALTLDRATITKHILQGGQTPAKSLVPPDMGLFGGGYFGEESVEQARALVQTALTKLGLSKETLDPVHISFSPSLAYNLPIVQAVQKQWEHALGIKIELNMIDPKVYLSEVKEGKFELATRSWIADFYDPINFLEVFQYKKGGTNNTSWEHPRYVDLLQRSQVCRNVQERKVLLREAEQVLMDEMPIIPVFHFAMNYLQQDDVQGVVLSPLGQVDFRWAKKL